MSSRAGESSGILFRWKFHFAKLLIVLLAMSLLGSSSRAGDSTQEIGTSKKQGDQPNPPEAKAGAGPQTSGGLGAGGSGSFGKASPTGFGKAAPPSADAEPGEKASVSDDAGIPAARTPVPPETDVKKTRDAIHSLYESDFKAASTSTGKFKLAQKLAQLAGTSTKPVEQYVLLTEARDLAASSGDVWATSALIDRLAEQFEVDPLTEKLAQVRVLSRAVKSAAQKRVFVTQVLRIADDARRREDYKKAEIALEAGTILARSLNDRSLSERISAETRMLASLSAAYGEALAAQETLRTNSDSSKAHWTLGWYHCGLRQDPERGLSHLARGGRADLAKLIASESESSNLLLEELARGWETVTVDDPDLQQFCLQRAIHWHTQRLPEASPAEQAKILAHTTELREQLLKPRFAKILGNSANGVESASEIDCSAAVIKRAVKPAFRPQDSWLLSLQLRPGDLNLAEQQACLFWGSTVMVPNQGPQLVSHLSLVQTGPTLTVQTMSLPSASQYELRAPLPTATAADSWVDIKILFDGPLAQLEFYVDYKPAAPVRFDEPVGEFDRKSPMSLGGISINDQLGTTYRYRFDGQLKQLWFGNLE
ncbi:MAG: hypothetical protein SFV23_13070 [Planctomycetaceae bacterium]|nr:hypothetical protein [Planctomycetaceae bacterium]